MDEYYFISFENTNNAMQAEDFLKKNSFDMTIIPTPREVSQSCGLSIKFKSGNLGLINEYIKNGSIKIKGLYRFIKENGIRKIEKIQ